MQGFRVLGFKVQGFRILGFTGLGSYGLGFEVRTDRLLITSETARATQEFKELLRKDHT